MPKKKIIIGCDGTWLNSEDGYDRKSWWPWASTKKGSLVTPSNVTRICRALQPVQGSADPNVAVDHSGRTPEGDYQVVCYRPGIGSANNFLDRYWYGATADSIKSNIRDAYCAIVEHYEQGDEIFLIGFSRGSFVARSVATVVNDVGLLTKKGMEHSYTILEDWFCQAKDKNPDHVNWEHGPQKFKDKYKELSYLKMLPGSPSNGRWSTYSEQLVKDGFTRMDIRIKAVACWDTVGSLGIPQLVPTHPFLRPFTGFINRILKHFDKAINLQFVNNEVLPCVDACFHALALDEKREPYSPTLWELPKDRDPNSIVLEQVWFPGAHGNIGGSVLDENLPELALYWMISQLETHGHLHFDHDYLAWCVANAPQNKRLAEKATHRQISRSATGWGLGSEYDTFAGSGSYNKLGGIMPRTPGRYFNGPGEERRTHEYIHPSVRVRRATSHLHPNWVATDEVDGTYEARARPKVPFVSVRSDSPSEDHTRETQTQELNAHLADSPLHHQTQLQLFAPRGYTRWNLHLHLPLHHQNQKPSALASSVFYDPPALDVFRLHSFPNPEKNWDGDREIMERETGVCMPDGAGADAAGQSRGRNGWEWVMLKQDAGTGKTIVPVSKGSEVRIPEWKLQGVEGELVRMLGRRGGGESLDEEE